MRAAILAVILVALAAPAKGQIASKQTGAVGWGMHTCGEFANQYMKNIHTEQVYFAWTQGYITALNSMRLVQDKPILNLQPSSFGPEVQMDFIRGFCSEAPLKPYLNAVGALWEMIEGLNRMAPN